MKGQRADSDMYKVTVRGGKSGRKTNYFASRIQFAKMTSEHVRLLFSWERGRLNNFT